MPPIPPDFIAMLGKQAVNKENPEGLRAYFILYLLIALDSLRFADAADVSALWLTDKAVCAYR